MAKISAYASVRGKKKEEEKYFERLNIYSKKLNSLWSARETRSFELKLYIKKEAIVVYYTGPVCLSFILEFIAVKSGVNRGKKRRGNDEKGSAGISPVTAEPYIIHKKLK